MCEDTHLSVGSLKHIGLVMKHCFPFTDLSFLPWQFLPGTSEELLKKLSLQERCCLNWSAGDSCSVCVCVSGCRQPNFLS